MKRLRSQSGILISVVMPTLNCAALLPQSLSSLVEQTFSGFEVIIVDGGSSDDTVNEARQQLETKRIRCRCIVAPGTGIYEAMNLGMMIARGDWLYFLGSDDRLYEPQVFERIAPSLLVSRANLVHGEAWIEKPGYFYCGEFPLGRLLERNLSHQSVFYRRSTLEANCLTYNERYSLYADWDLNLKLLAHGPFESLEQPVAIYACEGFSSGKIDELFMHEKEANVIDYFGWRAFLLMPVYRLALGVRVRPRRDSRLLFSVARAWRALSKFMPGNPNSHSAQQLE
jgi:glycosyltransferase involved in cell wall biosynthesis